MDLLQKNKAETFYLSIVLPAVLVLLSLFPAELFSQGSGRIHESKVPVWNDVRQNGMTPVPFITSLETESFEDTLFPPPGWVKLNPVGGSGWGRITAGTPVPGWFEEVASVPPGGGSAVAFATYTFGGATSNDMWLVTPRIENISLNDSLVFWLKNGPATDYSDKLDIIVSTTVNYSTQAFVYKIDHIIFPTNSDSAWKRKAYMLGDVSGLTNGDSIYIAFREHVADNQIAGSVLSVDLVRVGNKTIGIENEINTIPSGFRLEQNYPNPFNPVTGITYSVAVPGFVSLKVYDVMGKETAVLVDEFKPAGTYSVKFNGSNLSSGMYFYRLLADSYSETRKMILSK